MRKTSLGATSFRVKHLEAAIVPETYPQIYQWHKYWGRKSPNMVRAFIEAYCPPEGVVIDPFVGSGVTAIEALRSGRRAIVNDLNPVSRDIVLATVKPISQKSFSQILDRLKELVEARVRQLYAKKCQRCDNDVEVLATLIDGETRKPLEFRYRCSCQKSLILEPATELTLKEYGMYSKRLKKENLWWPAGDMSYENGESFSTAKDYKSYSDLFSSRNLLALAQIWDCIAFSREWTRAEYDLLSCLFRSIIHLCSLVSADRRVRPLSTGWTQHFYWRPLAGVEINVWGAFERKLIEYRKAIKEWIGFNVGDILLAAVPQEVTAGKANLFISTGDCATFTHNLRQAGIKADYCFTDPPYNGMIQYGELSYMWNAWRKEHLETDDAMKTFFDSEMTENLKQGKNRDAYFLHLRSSFQGLCSTLNPGSYMHITYSSPKIRYRNMTLRAARLAGLEFEKLHFQPPMRPSKAALEKPFGSVFGDFIFRFQKPVKATSLRRSVSEQQFMAIVEERTEYILRHRAEATPLPIVVAECERELYKCGFFDDEKSVLRNIENEVKKSEKFIVAGQHVDFRDAHTYDETPLSLRVEKSIRNSLAQARVVTFTDVWRSILQEYPNSLTPDSALLVTCLKKFADQRAGGKWELRDGAMQSSKASTHDRLIYKCATLAIKSGFDCAVGAPELAKGSFSLLEKKLKPVNKLFEELKRLNVNLTRQQQKRVANVDLIAWKKQKGEGVLLYAFEVETSTNFIDAFERFESLHASPLIDAKMVMLIAERLPELQGKMLTKSTFSRIPVELTAATFVVGDPKSGILRLTTWTALKKIIDKCPTWLELQNSLTLFPLKRKRKDS